MLTSTPCLPTAPLVDAAVSLLANVPTSAVFCTFLMCADGSSTSSSSIMLLHWLCKYLSRVRLTNRFLILKLLVFDSISKLYDNRHLPENRCFLLPSSLFYFCDGLLHSSHSFYSLHLSYCSHSLHLSDPLHIVLFYFWDQRVQHYGVYIPRNLES